MLDLLDQALENIRGALLYDEVPDPKHPEYDPEYPSASVTTAGRRPETIDHFAATVFNV